MCHWYILCVKELSSPNAIKWDLRYVHPPKIQLASYHWGDIFKVSQVFQQSSLQSVSAARSQTVHVISAELNCTRERCTFQCDTQRPAIWSSIWLWILNLQLWMLILQDDLHTGFCGSLSYFDGVARPSPCNVKCLDLILILIMALYKWNWIAVNIHILIDHFPCCPS